MGENWILPGCPSQTPLDSASGECLAHPSSLGLSQSKGHRAGCSHFLGSCSLPSWLWVMVIRETAQGTGGLVLWVPAPFPQPLQLRIVCLHSLAGPHFCPWLLPVPLHFFLSSNSFLFKFVVFNFPLLFCVCYLLDFKTFYLSTFI